MLCVPSTCQASAVLRSKYKQTNRDFVFFFFLSFDSEICRSAHCTDNKDYWDEMHSCVSISVHRCAVVSVLCIFVLYRCCDDDDCCCYCCKCVVETISTRFVLLFTRRRHACAVHAAKRDKYKIEIVCCAPALCIFDTI